MRIIDADRIYRSCAGRVLVEASSIMMSIECGRSDHMRPVRPVNASVVKKICDCIESQIPAALERLAASVLRRSESWPAQCMSQPSEAPLAGMSIVFDQFDRDAHFAGGGKSHVLR